MAGNGHKLRTLINLLIFSYFKSSLDKNRQTTVNKYVPQETSKLARFFRLPYSILCKFTNIVNV